MPVYNPAAQQMPQQMYGQPGQQYGHQQGYNYQSNPQQPTQQYSPQQQQQASQAAQMSPAAKVCLRILDRCTTSHSPNGISVFTHVLLMKIWLVHVYP